MADLKLTLAVLSAAHFAHYQTLAPADAEVFAQKPIAERESILKAALDADPVKYTAKDGTVYRESQSQLAVLAKKSDDTAELLAKSEAANTLTALRVDAKALLSDKGMHGSLDVHAAILGAVRGIADEKLRGECLQSLTAWSAGGVARLAPGVNPEREPQKPATDKLGAFEALEVGLLAFCAEKKIDKPWTDGLSAFSLTPDGKALADAYNATLKK